jgi:hypothetical protein
MLRNILIELDGGRLVEQSKKLFEDKVSFSLEANRLLREQPFLKDFFNIAEILVGKDVHLDAASFIE